MNKICTSVEQSKKLIDLGIDRTTADMYWSHVVADTMVVYEPRVITLMPHANESIPAWSLSALMHLMPTHYVVEKCSDSYCCYIFSVKEFFANTAVDVAFEMVCWLKENKML